MLSFQDVADAGPEERDAIMRALAEEMIEASGSGAAGGDSSRPSGPGISPGRSDGTGGSAGRSAGRLGRLLPPRSRWLALRPRRWCRHWEQG